MKAAVMSNCVMAALALLVADAPGAHAADAEPIKLIQGYPDHDRDGRISYDEFASYHSSILVRKHDKNGDQYLSRDEISGSDPAPDRSDATTIRFSNADKNRDGRLSRDELHQATRNSTGVRAMFQKLDTNGDGYLSEDELKKARGLAVVRIQF
jgi:Ca2+-binding EF-hand superfamily protein